MFILILSDILKCWCLLLIHRLWLFLRRMGIDQIGVIVWKPCKFKFRCLQRLCIESPCKFKLEFLFNLLLHLFACCYLFTDCYLSCIVGITLQTLRWIWRVISGCLQHFSHCLLLLLSIFFITLSIFLSLQSFMVHFIIAN